MMTTNITIFFTSQIKIDDTSFQIVIDNTVVEYSINNKKIIIDVDIPFGFHSLTIFPKFDLTNKNKVRFDNVQINKAGLKHTRYLSYCIKHNKKENTTILSEYHPSWTLPFGNPVCWWLAECANRIKTRVWGDQLENYYNVSYPTSIEIDKKFPTIVRDFFKYNFGFHIYDKNIDKTPLNNQLVPFISLPNLKYDEEKMLAEFTEHFELFEKDNDLMPDQTDYNSYAGNDQDGDWDKTIHRPFRILRTSNGEEKHNLSDIFPEFSRLLKSLEDDGIKIGLSFIGALYPDSYVPPHIDSYYEHAAGFNNKGLCKIWIPIGWEPGSYFKFDKVGLLPHEKGAHLINPHDFTHCSINQSSSVRFSVGFNCEFENDIFLKYL